MNSENIYSRIESLHQRTLIRILYEFLYSKINEHIHLGCINYVLRKFYNIFCKDIKPIIHIKVGHLLIYCRNFKSEFVIEFGDRILLTNVIISNSKVSESWCRE